MFDTLLSPLKAFIDPSQRIYWVFLIISFFIAFALYLRQKEIKSFRKFLGGKEAWASASAFTDYSWFILGFWINLFLIAPNIISLVDLNMFFVSLYYDIFSPINISISSTNILISYTLILVILLDFTYFLIHYALHKYKFLWDCHKFHHSATSLNPITLYRTHPMEYIIFALQKVIVLSVVTSLFIYQFGMVIQPIEFYGIGIGTLIFGILGSNLRHSQVPFKYFDWLENIFISPYMHQVHHGKLPSQHHSNFGAIFSIWDRMFGTLKKSKQIDVQLTYGIEGYTHTSIIKSVFLPFINLTKRKNQ